MKQTQKMKFPEIMVDEYTSPIEAFATPDLNVESCYKLISDHGYRHLPVIQDDKIVGILSQRDLNLSYGFESQRQYIKASDIMRRDPFVVNHNDPLEKVVFALSHRKIGSALVKDADGNVNGIFTTTDAMNALIELLHAQADNAKETL